MVNLRIFAFIFALACLSASPLRAEVARDNAACGSMSAVGSGVDTGPYDYRHAPRDKLYTVEKYHFTSSVQRLRGGASGAVIGADLDFVLRHFPNHTRALSAMVELAKREKTDKPRGSRFGLDCWFDRAVRMAPDDLQVRLLYGIWLAKKGERALALEQLEEVSKAAEISANMSYNLGLAYCEVNAFDKALVAAHRAYAEGYDLPGLRNRLKKAGKWRELPDTPAESKEGDAASTPPAVSHEQ